MTKLNIELISNVRSMYQAVSLMRANLNMEFIAKTAHGLNKVRADFLAEIADIYFHGIGQYICIIIPNVVNNLLLGYNFAAVTHQKFQQGKLFTGKLNW